KRSRRRHDGRSRAVGAREVPLRRVEVPAAVSEQEAKLGAATGGPVNHDPYAWLEEVEGEAPLAWARERNAHAQAALTSSTRFEEIRAGALQVLDSSEKIPAPMQHGDHLYNFWTD